MRSARDVLDAHTELYELLKNPPAALVEFADRYVIGGGELVREQRQQGWTANLTAEERTILKSWEYYTWPAETGLDLLGLWGAPLFSAPTYQVTAEIVDAVTGMYRLTASGEPELRASEMPARTGFAYLDEPVTFTDFSGGTNTIQAFSWAPQLFSPPGAQPAKGVRISAWDLDAVRGPARDSLGGGSSVFVPYGSPLSTGVSDDPTRWLHCLWLFMGTEVTEAAKEPADRSARRRAQRSGWQYGDVAVILLRRRHGGDGDGHRDIDWSCRWIVQGHDRHLGDYRGLGIERHHAKPPGPGQPCSVCGLRTTYIGAYIKGPEGRQLKPTAAKLFRVSR